MISVRGYITSRPSMDGRTPQKVQNLVIRNFCEKNNFFYVLSATEYSIPKCYKALYEVMEQLKGLKGIVAYSLFQLPENNELRYSILKRMIKNKKTFYFALENMKVVNTKDIELIENIWLIRKTLPNCLKKI